MKKEFKAMQEKQDTPKVGVGVILQRKNDNKILVLLRQGSHRNATWAVPGGHMNIGEEFIDTCKREIKEELDLVIDDVKKVDFVNNIFEKEGLHYITLYFKAIWDDSQEPKIMEPNKIKAWRWIEPSHLPKPFFSKNAVEILKRFSMKDLITDGFGNYWSKICPNCKEKTMMVMRPGQVQCGFCG